MTFNDASNENQDSKKVSLDYPEKVLQAFLKFIYTGQTQVGSDILIDVLSLAHEVLATQLKQTIEGVLASNISFNNFNDTYLVAQGFDCLTLKDSLIAFG